MAGLTSYGYEPRSPQDIKQSLVNELTLTDPEFTEQEADIQNNLLDTAIVPIAQFEKLVEVMLNSYSPDYANDDMFLRFAESVGLRPKAAFNAQVILTFTGNIGDIIPKNTEITDANETAIFKTIESAVVSSVGTIDVLAYSESNEIFPANSLTVIKSILQGSVKVNNKNTSLKYIEAETLDQLKARVQARFRSTRMGGRIYATSLLKTVPGVDMRLVQFYTTSKKIEENGTTYWVNGIEAVIGGGDDYDVGFALFQSFLETQKLISSPSDDDTSRSIDLNLYVYNSSVPVSFTRPKLINLGLTLMITFTSNISTPTSIESMLSPVLIEYINNLQVGTSVSGWSLNAVAVPIMEKNGIKPYIIASIRWMYKYNDVVEYKNFDNDNKIPVILKDCYCLLKEFGVSINK